jgi:ubiquinone/menaquinone biosynthesis C-methylase UbiE
MVPNSDWATTRKKELMTKYDITSSNYDELYREEQHEKYETSWSRLLSRTLPGSRRVCDIGAGTLLFYEYLREKAATYSHYVGLDLSPGMLSHAAAKSRGDAVVDLVQADAAHLPLRANACSVTVSFTVIDLVPEQPLFVHECRRVTHGICIVSSLKKAHQGVVRVPRIGRVIGETDKDIIYAAEIGG